jgi:hypothetical protein
MVTARDLPVNGGSGKFKHIPKFRPILLMLCDISTH